MPAQVAQSRPGVNSKSPFCEHTPFRIDHVRINAVIHWALSFDRQRGQPTGRALWKEVEAGGLFFGLPILPASRRPGTARASADVSVPGIQRECGAALWRALALPAHLRGGRPRAAAQAQTGPAHFNPPLASPSFLTRRPWCRALSNLLGGQHAWALLWQQQPRLCSQPTLPACLVPWLPATALPPSLPPWGSSCSAAQVRAACGGIGTGVCARSVTSSLHLWHCCRFSLGQNPITFPWLSNSTLPLSGTLAAAVGLAARTQQPAARHRLLEAVIASLISSRRSLGGVTQKNVDQGVDYVLSSVLTNRVLGSTDMDEEQYI